MQKGIQTTLDFVLDGKKSWELKTVIEVGDNTIRNDIWHATDQLKQNIMLDVTWMDKDTTWILDKALKHLSIKKNRDLIDHLVLVKGRKFIQVK